VTPSSSTRNRESPWGAGGYEERTALSYRGLPSRTGNCKNGEARKKAGRSSETGPSAVYRTGTRYAWLAEE